MISRQRQHRRQRKVAYQNKQTLTQKSQDNSEVHDVDDVEHKKISEKYRWHKRKDQVNLKRRQSYSTDPSPVRRRVKHAYRQHTTPIKRHVREAYHSNPSPVKKRVLRRYHDHPSPFKQRARRAYHSNVFASRSL